MDISSSFDPSQKAIIMKVTSNLIEKYYPNFSGMLKKGVKRATIDVSRVDKTAANIIISLDKSNSSIGSVGTAEISENLGMIKAAIDKNMFIEIIGVIDKFSQSALLKEFQTSEFCPLSGYDFEKLKEDVEAAIEAKRNLIFVDSFENYRRAVDTMNLKFDQYLVKYGTSEWADMVLLIMSGDFEKLKNIVTPKLKVMNWV